MGQQPDAIGSLTSAFDKMSELLFQNFEARHWGILGIVAFLVNCGRGMKDQGSDGIMGGAASMLQTGGGDNWFYIMFGVNILLTVIFGAVFFFLSTKAEFSMASKIATGNLETPLLFMDEYSEKASSLFKLKMGLLFLPYLLFTNGYTAVTLYLYSPSYIEMSADEGMRSMLLGFLLVFMISMIFFFIGYFFNNYVVPIMYAKNISAFTALSEGFALIKNHPGQAALHMLFRFLFSFVNGMIIAVMVYVSMCCFCIGLIPVVGSLIVTILTAPLHVFLIAHSMYFIQSHGSEYHMFGSIYGTDGGNGPYYNQPPGGPGPQPGPPGPQNPTPPQGGFGGAMSVQPTLEEYEAQQQQGYDPYAPKPQQPDPQQGTDPYLPPQPPQQYPSGSNEPPPPGDVRSEDYDTVQDETELYAYPDQRDQPLEPEDKSYPPPMPEERNDPPRPSRAEEDDNDLPPPPPPIPKDDDGKPYPPPPPPPEN